MAELQKGEPVGKNWVTINEQGRKIARMEMEIARLREAAQELRKTVGDVKTRRFPFRVYWLSNKKRSAHDADAWRKFYVQHGYVNGIKTDGCDDTDDEGTTPTEIVVPDGTPVYYVWAVATLTDGEVTAVEIDHGASGWTGFPGQPDLPDTFYALIAKIDTDTRSDQERPIIRQSVYQDIALGAAGDGGDPRWA